MRTKFRLWDKGSKCFYWKDCFTISSDGDIFIKGSDYSFIADDEDYVLQQFTGFFDSEGKEIYEGDILNFPEDHAILVEWEPSFSGFYPFLERGDYHYGGEFEKPTIVGNVMENPEIIK
jgi:uncharacterized phage protein (TIGR01671 family)